MLDAQACPHLEFYPGVPLPLLLLLPYSTVFFCLCIWMSHYHASASLAEQAFGSGSCLDFRVKLQGANNSVVWLLRLCIDAYLIVKQR
jgi:hypothetical protein